MRIEVYGPIVVHDRLAVLTGLGIETASVVIGARVTLIQFDGQLEIRNGPVVLFSVPVQQPPSQQEFAQELTGGQDPELFDLG